MKRIAGFLRIVGIVMIALSCGLLVFSKVHESRAEKEAASVAAEIGQMLPERTPGIPGEYSDPEMPALEFQGRDYVCLLDVPALGVSLPVQSSWKPGRLSENPCKFWGSCYDGTLILGGSNRKGQFDFCSRLDLGDRVVITDMRGSEYSFNVARIDRSRTAEIDRLSDDAYDLTLFVRESLSSGYIIVRCTFPNN